MNMSKAYEVGTIRKFKVPYSMESEGRVFYENEIYEAHYKEGWQGVQEGGALTVSFFAENGYFNFTDELFERVIKGWDLVEVES